MWLGECSADHFRLLHATVRVCGGAVAFAELARKQETSPRLHWYSQHDYRRHAT